MVSLNTGLLQHHRDLAKVYQFYRPWLGLTVAGHDILVIRSNTLGDIQAFVMPDGTGTPADLMPVSTFVYDVTFAQFDICVRVNVREDTPTLSEAFD